MGETREQSGQSRSPRETLYISNWNLKSDSSNKCMNTHRADTGRSCEDYSAG